ncbi:MAG TPA: tetratricopeptide repeat protein [Rhodothermales bacterium]|nr:tetratricopeptide repeat protein [Rhodothermales bacterium]
MRKISLLAALVLSGVLWMGAGCGGDPNVEGAKLDLRNKDYAHALENINTALENNPNNAQAYLVKGEILQDQAANTTDVSQHSQMVADMAAAYNKAVEVDPSLEAEVSNKLKLAYYNEFQKGGQAFNKARQGNGEYADAVAYFQNAVKLQPDSAGAYVNLGYSLLNADRADEAIEPLQTAVNKGGGDADLYTLLSGLYMNNDRAADAVELLESAQTKFPDNAEIRSQLLNAYVASGQEDRALQQYQQAVASDPNNKIFRYNYGSLLLQSENYDEAINQLKAAVQIDPNYAVAQYNLGAAYVNKAVDLNDRISAIDDSVRAHRDELSDAQEQAQNERMNQLAEQRTQYFTLAVEPLEKAKELMDTSGDDAMAVCQALFQAYVQTKQTDKAEGVSQCAGYGNMNNGNQ